MLLNLEMWYRIFIERERMGDIMELVRVPIHA